MPPHEPIDQEDAREPVNVVVLKALSTLAPMFDRTERRPPLESYLTSMKDAALAPTPGPMGDLARSMQKARISGIQIIDSYVPVVARRLGDDWVADRLDFSAVTIGAARLQGLVRRLDRDGAFGSTEISYGAPGILVGVPEGEQHTLGATVLAGMLRQHGVSVHLELELSVSRLVAELARQRFMGVFLTASGEGHLEPLRQLVACSHYESAQTPVILGGPITELIGDMTKRIGADLVTSDIDEALRLCRMTQADEMALPRVIMSRAGE